MSTDAGQVVPAEALDATEYIHLAQLSRSGYLEKGAAPLVLCTQLDKRRRAQSKSERSSTSAALADDKGRFAS